MLLLIPSLLFLVLSGCGDQGDVRVLRLGHTLDAKHSVHVAIEYMAQRLEEISGGRMRVEIYPGGVLGSERESLELLQLGTLDITKVSTAALEGFVEEYRVFGLPYIFRDKEHAFAVLDGPIGQELLGKGESCWLKGLCFYDSGARSFYSSIPIESPSDLAGLKIRVTQSITSFDMVRAMGAAPTPISWGELYTALQGGVVDGAENNPPSFYLSHHYEVCPFYSLDEHTRIPDILIISTHTMDDLSAEEKDWLMQAVGESVQVQREEWERSEQEALESIVRRGVTVSTPEREAFVEASKSVYQSYESNPELARLIGEIQATSPESPAEKRPLEAEISSFDTP